MRRREVVGLAGIAATAPLVARAQPSGVTKRIAVLMGLAENDPEGQSRIAAFRQGLSKVNLLEGRNAHIDIRWGAGDAVRTRAYARELVNLAPDAILGTNTPTVRALKEATRKIPIVFAGLSDPISDGIVASLSKPEGNITGFVSFDASIAGKWIQLLTEVAPGVDRAAVLYNPDTAPHAIFFPTMENAARQVGMTLTRAPVRDGAAIEHAITGLSAARGGGLVIIPDVFSALHKTLIFDLAIREHLPTICPVRQFASAGGLISYGSNFDTLYRQAASYIDRVLRGESPHDLPVQEPTRYELIINLKTARALGLKVPPLLLARADEVIE
jgi:putative ABC transport system substrate-binding protein